MEPSFVFPLALNRRSSFLWMPLPCVLSSRLSGLSPVCCESSCAKTRKTSRLRMCAVALLESVGSFLAIYHYSKSSSGAFLKSTVIFPDPLAPRQAPATNPVPVFGNAPGASNAPAASNAHPVRSETPTINLWLKKFATLNCPKPSPHWRRQRSCGREHSVA